MGRKKINEDRFTARFPEGVMARMIAALRSGESLAAFIRTAVERELKRRERESR